MKVFPKNSKPLQAVVHNKPCPVTWNAAKLFERGGFGKKYVSNVLTNLKIFINVSK